jgi:hypothetical protein
VVVLEELTLAMVAAMVAIPLLVVKPLVGAQVATLATAAIMSQAQLKAVGQALVALAVLAL